MGKQLHLLSNFDEDRKYGECARCGRVRIKWVRHFNKSLGINCYKSRCLNGYNEQKQKWRERNPNYVNPNKEERAQRRKLSHGLTSSEAKEFKKGKICGICSYNGALVVDHSHQTGKIRGALCQQCNIGLGMFDDNIEWLKLAIDYLNGATNA